MSREIKFRVWNIKYKEMRLVELYWFEEQQIRTVPEDTQAYYEVMQYTGLHDAKGKEIYEGDILGLEDIEDQSRVVIVFEKAAFRAELVRHKGFYDNLWVEDTDWIIIGNIHEHPNLLKEGQG